MNWTTKTLALLLSVLLRLPLRIPSMRPALRSVLASRTSLRSPSVFNGHSRRPAAFLRKLLGLDVPRLTAMAARDRNCWERCQLHSFMVNREQTLAFMAAPTPAPSICSVKSLRTDDLKAHFARYLTAQKIKFTPRLISGINAGTDRTRILQPCPCRS